MANELYEVYIKDGSIKQLNLFDELRNQLEDRIKHQSYSGDMFDEARAEVFNLMKRSSYPSFLSSQHYRELMQHVKQVGVVRLKKNEAN